MSLESILFWGEIASAPDPLQVVAPSVRAFVGDLVLVSANVCTLHPAEEHTLGMVSARRLSLIESFRRAGASIVGVQEARGKFKCKRWVEDFYVVASASDKGHGGMELWISSDLHPDPGSVSVLVSEPRRLCVNLDLGSVRLQVLVLHVPDSGSVLFGSDAQVSQWWEVTRSLANKFKSMSRDRVVLIDSNDYVGSEQSDAIGGKQGTEQNHRGKCFHEALLSWGLAVPSTFYECPNGGKTWFDRQGKGRGHRIDFVCVSLVSGSPMFGPRVP